MFTLFCLFIIASPLSASVVKDVVDSCSPTEFSCGDGGCVSEELVCDGSRNCADGSDELSCGRGSITMSAEDPVLHRSRRQASQCRKDQWKCRDGSCISFDGKCDGIVDCQDRSDETHALCRKTLCQPNWFRCTYGACVDGTAPCNNVQECADSSDELLPKCRNETEEVRGQFKCADGTFISAANHCDGVRDCADGSDETIRTCAAKTCPSYLFQCAYGACVDRGSDCNKVVECADGSDEAPELCDKNLPSTPTVTVKPQTGNCVLPNYPAHGTYVTNMPNAKPGDAFDFITVNVTCRQGYGVDGSESVYCYNGWWPENIPKCAVYCQLKPHPSVEYRCLVSGSVEGSRACNEQEPSGTVVSPQCRTPNYYSATTLTFMRCIEGNWDYIARCSPGLTKNGTNITILIKDTVEVHVGDFQYTVPTESQIPVVPIKNNGYTRPSIYEDDSKYSGIFDTTTSKHQDEANSNIIFPDTYKNEATDTKIDESDYQIDAMDWRMGVPTINDNRNTQNEKSYTRNKPQKNDKSYTTNSNSTNIYFNISNSSVFIYADDKLVLRN